MGTPAPNIPVLHVDDAASGQVLSDEGAQGVIHRISDDIRMRVPMLMNLPWPLLGKVYRAPPNPKETARLGRVVTWLWSLPYDEWERFIDRVAWPIGLLGDESGRLRGVIIRDLTPAYGFPYTTPTGASQQKMLLLRHCLQEDDYLQTHFGHPAVLDDRRRVQILDAVCACVAAVHRYGIAINDYSENNVALRLTDDHAEACLIDADSMGLQGDVVDALVTPFWGVPEGQTTLSRPADVYRVAKTAVYLFGRARRGGRERIDSVLPEELRAVAHRSYARDPHLRPAIGDWEIDVARCRARVDRARPAPEPIAAAARPPFRVVVQPVSPPPVQPQVPKAPPSPARAQSPTVPPVPAAVGAAPPAGGIDTQELLRPLMRALPTLALAGAAIGGGYAIAVAGARQSWWLAAFLLIGAVMLVVRVATFLPRTPDSRLLMRWFAPVALVGAFAVPTAVNAGSAVPPFFPDKYLPIVEVSTVSLKNAAGHGDVDRVEEPYVSRFFGCRAYAWSWVVRARLLSDGGSVPVTVGMAGPSRRWSVARLRWLGGREYRATVASRVRDRPLLHGTYVLRFIPIGESDFDPVRVVMRFSAKAGEDCPEVS